MDNQAARWYRPNKKNETDEKDRATQLIAETAAIEMRQSSWHELNLWNATLFSNRQLVGFRWGEIIADRELWPVNLRTENLIEEIGEAMLSKASQSPLKPSLVAHGMSIATDRAVRLLDSFLFGVWRQTLAEEACIMMFLDAYISGLGCIRVAFDGNKKQLHVEPVFFDNVIIDNREVANRVAPRTYRIRQVLPRAAVEARFGVELGDQPRYVDYRDVSDGWVVLVEAWRLPDSKGNGGYHAVACTDKMLVDEEYKEDWVPLVFMHWADQPSGWFGKSGVEQLIPFQNRHNDLNDAIEAAQDITCRPRILLNANSMINTEQWDNEAGRFLLWSGVEPKPFEWRTSVEPLQEERVRNRQMAYAHVAMSEMYANADLPEQVRLDSSAGVREFRNMEDSRHLRLWTRFERARLDVAKTILRVLGTSKGADAFSAAPHPGASKMSAKKIPWKAVKQLNEDQYTWTLEAVPLSSMSPAARRELLRDWTSRGLVTDQDEARRMEGNPNLERIEMLQMANRDDITRVIGLMEEGDYEAPDETTDVDGGTVDVLANLKRLKQYEDVKPEVIQLHYRWLIDATAIQKKRQQAMIAQQIQTQQQLAPFAPTQGMPGTSAAVGNGASATG